MKSSLVTKTVVVPDNFETGAALRRQRREAGLTLDAVSKKMGISASHLSDLERGFRTWTVELVKASEDAIWHGKRS